VTPFLFIPPEFEVGKEAGLEGGVEAVENRAGEASFADEFELLDELHGGEFGVGGDEAEAGDEAFGDAGLGALEVEPAGELVGIVGVVHGNEPVDPTVFGPDGPVLSLGVGAIGPSAPDCGAEGDVGEFPLYGFGNALDGAVEFLLPEFLKFVGQGAGDLVGPMGKRAAEVGLEGVAGGGSVVSLSARIAEVIEVDSVQGGAA